MTEEKELVRRIKNSFKAKKSKAEVIRKLQQRGYKLEYIEALMKKATIGKTVLIIFGVVLIVIASLAVAAYSFIYNKEKLELNNPLDGITVNFGSRTSLTQNPNQTTEVYLEDIEITPEFLSYLLNEIGAWQLHKNPLNLEEPVINFIIDNTEFYSIIDGSIDTFEDLSEEADIQFKTNKEDIILAILSETPDEVFKESLSSGKTIIETIAPESELFAKGYLQLYDSLK